VVREIGAKYAREVLPGTVRRQAQERLDWHRTQNDRIVIVSAAPDAYMTEWCKIQQLDLICTELEAIDGILTGRFKNGDCVGVEKVRRIQQRYRLEAYGCVYAYGDTSEDSEMLALADRMFYRWEEVTGPVAQRRRSDHVHQTPDA